MKEKVFEFKESVKLIKQTRNLTVAAMLLALSIVFTYMGNFSLVMIPIAKMSLAFIPRIVSAVIFGPFITSMISGLTDIIAYFLNPIGGAFFPGWTINAFLEGLVLGIILYKKEASIKNLIIAFLINAIFIQLIMGTLWLNIQFGLPYIATLIGRSIKALIVTPLEIGISYYIIKKIKKIKLI